MKKFKLLFLAIICLSFVFPQTADAYEIRADNAINIGPDQTIEGNLYATGNTLNIEGVINGDVFFAGQTMTISGKVSGDVFAAGQFFNIGGEVDGSVRAAGNSLIVNGLVKQNIIFFGNTFSLQKDGNVGWDLFMAGANAGIDGQIGRGFYGAVANADISGKINEGVKLKMGEDQGSKDYQALKINESAEINGDLNYSSKNEAKIMEGANISGNINFTKPEEKKFNPIAHGYKFLFSVFSALVIGLVLISLWKKPIIEITNKMQSNTAATIGWGIIIFFITPIISILLLFTIIGIPLALIIFVIWLIFLYFGKIFAGILIGQTLMKKLLPKKNDSLIWSMIIGVVVAWLIFSIPLIGWALSLAAVWWGMGGTWLYFRKN